MRITQETFHNLASDAVEKRVNVNKQITAAYLHGSVLGEDALIGETTDIDLTLVYRKGFAPDINREFVRLSTEIHLDILHFDEAVFKPPRSLRGQAWLGNAVYDFKALFDPRHFLDFVQAGVRNTFYEPEVILERAQSFYDSARLIWREDSLLTGQDLLFSTSRYLTAMDNAVNAIANLNGPPLTIRRLVDSLPHRMAEFGDQGFLAGFLGLSGLQNAEQIDIESCLKAWHEIFPQAAEVDPEMPLLRLAYYRNAIQAYLDDGKKAAAVWILMKTWLRATLTAARQEEQKPQIPLQNALAVMGFSPENIKEKWSSLDIYLDKIDEYFDHWKSERGI